MRRALPLIAVAALSLLVACTEKPQTNSHGVKIDAMPWSGTGAQANSGTAFTSPGWKVGNAAEWQQHLKTRALNGQNDYATDK
ncbi:MAG: hypothetical protein KJ901_09010 [Gammaproteobacteria bacterium]|nr:hypothetical protein [Gammaproteobacteria bacterium]MBU1443120.1 hypothetical protein [Gammaproteobacteria bacterium]